MKAADFDYHQPQSRAQALELLAGGHATVLAGGQSLMPMMNFRLAAPDCVVDVNRISDLVGITHRDGWLTIGAMTRYGQLMQAPEISTHAPLIARALPYIAHPAIRNRGTIGGSCALCDPAAEMPALLLALEAEIELQSQTGIRRMRADAFFLGLYETARAEDELLVAIHIPTPQTPHRIGFHEITQRHGDYAMAGCAITATADLEELRVAFFGVADCAARAHGVEAALQAKGGGADQAVADALDEISFAADTQADAKTKRHLASVALRRAWAELVA